ncbi:MAG TPA: hypothetical protein VK870_01015 [Ignavibacteriaceae bacterium]|nr:hypothetical protein [Ignavibacteriaceae bacterium]
MNKHCIFLFAFLLITTCSVYPQEKLALHFSDATNKIESAKLLEKITYWELFLLNNKINYDVIYDKDLESGISHKKYHTIMFPYTKVVSKDAYVSIVKYLEKGGNLIAFGEFCFYEQGINTKSFERLEYLFGVLYSGSIQQKQMSLLAEFNNQFPLTKDIANRLLIQVSAKSSPVYVEIISSKSISISKVKSDKTNNKIERSLIVLNTLLNSKAIWFSFDPLEIISSRDDVVKFGKIILNTINWFEESVPN